MTFRHGYTRHTHTYANARSQSWTHNEAVTTAVTAIEQTVARLKEEKAALCVIVVGRDAEDPQTLPLAEELLFSGVNAMMRGRLRDKRKRLRPPGSRTCNETRAQVPESDPTSVSRTTPAELPYGSSLEFQSTAVSFLCSRTAFLQPQTHLFICS